MIPLPVTVFFLAAMTLIFPMAAEAAYQGLPAAPQPGRLRLPLTVHERSGVTRSGAVVTGGVPFPPRFLTDVRKLRVLDPNGRPVVAQATVMTPWRKPAYDGSVQWALVSFRADVPAHSTRTYFLTDDGQATAPTSPLKVTRRATTITVETGAASFTLPREGNALLSSARIGGVTVIGRQGLRPTLTTGAWPERGLQEGAAHAGVHDATGVQVEEAGPARVVVAMQGRFTPGDKDRKGYDFTARLTFTAGSPSVRIVYTLSNGRLDPTLHPGPNGESPSRLAYVWPIQEASLVLDLASPAPRSATTLVENQIARQDVTSAPLTVYQSAQDGYKVTLADRPLATGAGHPGVLDLSDGTKGVTVARRFFREEWPGTLAAAPGELRVGLFPKQAGTLFALNPGQRKSWDLRLTLHGPEPPDLQACFNEQDALLLFRPDPAWMVAAAGETGAWSAGLALTPHAAPAAMRRGAFRPAPPPRGGWGGVGGWDRFGELGNWNAGGNHWNELTAFFRWVIHRDGAEFDNAEIPTLWAADHCPIHFPAPDLSAFFPYLHNGNAEQSRLKVLTYPGYQNRVTWGRPDTGHMGMWMWLEYYLLTGDARCREALDHLGTMARASLWRYTHDEKKDGTGAMPPGRIPDFARRDPDADPAFMLDTRYTGWPLYCLAQSYQLTGDAALLDEARIVARAFRNTARANPIGQLVKDAAGKNGTERTEYSATFNFPQGNGGVTSQVREWPKSASLVSSNFYSGIMIYGLREYYLVSRDLEALDTLVGQIDRFCHHSLIRNPAGAPAGWSYIFADYWGPYTWEDATDPRGGRPVAGFTSSNALVCDALARLYPLFPRADLAAVLQPAAEANGPDNWTVALTMAARHPKLNTVSPAAITDLTAEPLGDGKVRLTWTTPASAAWFQVKSAPAPIVERTAGWPDRTEPLPGTRAEWQARVAAFNAKQRAFWAAANVPGVPKPGAAGTKVSLVAEGLPAGMVHFAVKSWGADDAMSALSNVVAVSVR